MGGNSGIPLASALLSHSELRELLSANRLGAYRPRNHIFFSRSKRRFPVVAKAPSGTKISNGSRPSTSCASMIRISGRITTVPVLSNPRQRSRPGLWQPLCSLLQAPLEARRANLASASPLAEIAALLLHRTIRQGRCRVRRANRLRKGARAACRQPSTGGGATGP